MKTPKRKYDTSFLEWGDETYNILSQRKKEHLNRWKRKNRIAHLKRSLSRYKRGEHIQPALRPVYFALLEIPYISKNKGNADKAEIVADLTCLASHISIAASKIAGMLCCSLEEKTAKTNQSHSKKKEEK